MRMVKSPSELLLWDLESSPPITDATLILWGRANFAREGMVSIPNLVEDRADYFRKRYLAWVHAVGGFETTKGTVISQLRLNDNFSYWWMTLFVEKCNFAKSPQIADAIKLLAFNDWILSKNIKKITIASSNKNLVTCLLWLGEKLDIKVFWDRNYDKDQLAVSWRRRIIAIAPLKIRAYGWLFFRLIQIIPLRQLGVKAWKKSNATLTFISYFCNFSIALAQKGNFASQYWGGLPQKLILDGFRSNWLHLYVAEGGGIFSGAFKAGRILRSLNSTSRESGQCHVVLESFLTLGVTFKVLKTWAKIRGDERFLRDSLNQPLGEGLWIAPLFKDDWAQSFQGPVAVSNLLYLYLLEEAVGSLNRQKVGIYLQENQGWEFALINSWKSKAHGSIIGAPHSTVRFWDLRYYFDAGEYLNRDLHSLPLPDMVAVNGGAARCAFESAGYPPKSLVDIEALRFMNVAAAHKKNKPNKFHKSFTVLVLGDYLERVSHEQLDLLKESLQYLPSCFKYVYRPHPRCPIIKSIYLEMQMDWSNSELEDLLDKCDVVYTGSMTSAAVDAYCRGIPVISTLDRSGLNMSPLRGCYGVYFVENSTELAFAIRDACENPKSNIFKHDFFCTDADLSRWSKLLGESCKG